jgi:hypothetical protein
MAVTYPVISTVPTAMIGVVEGLEEQWLSYVQLQSQNNGEAMIYEYLEWGRGFPIWTTRVSLFANQEPCIFS